MKPIAIILMPTPQPSRLKEKYNDKAFKHTTRAEIKKRKTSNILIE